MHFGKSNSLVGITSSDLNFKGIYLIFCLLFLLETIPGIAEETSLLDVIRMKYSLKQGGVSFIRDAKTQYLISVGTSRISDVSNYKPNTNIDVGIGKFINWYNCVLWEKLI